MLSEVENFIERITHYKIYREPGKYLSDEELLQNWHKNRISECYQYLKVLNSRKDSYNLKPEINAVRTLLKQIELEYIKWKKLDIDME